MRIALFSDVHANLPAFESFLADIDTRKPDAVYCLGDLIGYNIWPNEVINEIRKRGIATLAGNHDLKVVGLTDSDKDYAYNLVSPDNREYLLALPKTIRLEFDRLGTILLAHGSPASVDEYVLEDTPEDHVLDLMGEARILCVGHSHKPYHRLVADGTRHVINIGSVGKPKDGNPDGCYVTISIKPTEKQLQVEVIRVKYDIERAVFGIKHSPLNEDLADKLRNAY